MNNSEVLSFNIESTREEKSIGWYSVVKRTFDIMVSMFGLIFLLPIMLVVKIMNICHKDFGSIFYTQERIGKDGKTFRLYKFRSMVLNAGEILEQLLKEEKYRKEWEENQKFENDPRITAAGKILRKTSLDELPQLLNVLKGDMSFIGPRPLIKGELDAHNGDHQLYEKVKPGLTGWWACNGRSATTYEKRLELEYYYVNNISLALDIKCIFRTIIAVITKDGAK